MTSEELKKLQKQLDSLSIDSPDPDIYIQKRIALFLNSPFKLDKNDGRADLLHVIKRKRLSASTLKILLYVQQRKRSNWVADTLYASINQEPESIRRILLKNHSDPTNFNHESNELWVGGACNKKAVGHHFFMYRVVKKPIVWDWGGRETFLDWLWTSSYFGYEKNGLIGKTWYEIQNIDFKKKIDASIFKKS
jgi:hypothetical protein